MTWALYKFKKYYKFAKFPLVDMFNIFEIKAHTSALSTNPYTFIFITKIFKKLQSCINL